MAGTSSSHKRKIHLARIMLSRKEREAGTAVFQGAQWRFKSFMGRLKNSPLMRERFEERKSLFVKLMEKQNAKKKKSKSGTKDKNSTGERGSVA
jgi:hypothetical protein